MYYYYHRWYDPSLGRFVSVDPVPGRVDNPQSLNPYVYVTNQPTLLTDPAGEYVAMCVTTDGTTSPCGVLRDSSGNLPPGTIILGSSTSSGTSSSTTTTTTTSSTSTSATTVTAPTGMLRDSSGNLPPGTTISVVQTPTGSVVTGTTTVANVNRQMDEDRARLGTGGPSIAALEQYQQCVQTAKQFVLAGGLLLTLDGPISLIGAFLIEVPPAAAVVEGIALADFVVGTALVLTGALYYGVNCHYPS